MSKYEPYQEKQLKNLGQRMRQLRKEKGYSNYEHFAFHIGVARPQYGRYENGQDLTFSSLLKVLNGLGVSLKEFFNEGFENFPPEDDNSKSK